MAEYSCPVWEEKRGREENNLDSDYQPALMQEEGNVSMATETTSKCHVKLVLFSQQTLELTLCTCMLSGLHRTVLLLAEC